MGLGFKEKVRGPSASGGFGNAILPPPPAPARGPATDRLSAMKAAFKNQYMNQVGNNILHSFLIIIINNVNNVSGVKKLKELKKAKKLTLSET